MSRLVCDKCGYSFLEEKGEIKRIYDLDVCYKCGGYEPVEIVEETVDITIVDSEE